MSQVRWFVEGEEATKSMVETLCVSDGPKIVHLAVKIEGRTRRCVRTVWIENGCADLRFSNSYPRRWKKTLNLGDVEPTIPAYFDMKIIPRMEGPVPHVRLEEARR